MNTTIIECSYIDRLLVGEIAKERNMSSSIIEFKNVVKRFGDRVAVNGVGLSVQDGEIFGLLGPNGAGKTTTISLLATLLVPDEGEIRICDYTLRQEANRVKPLIGFVPQEIALYQTLSAWDNLALFGRIYGLHGSTLKECVMNALALVGLSSRAADPVQTFSGGMKRRLNMAVGLVHQPRILFLDEPTVGVDPQSRNFIFEHVERLNRDGMTIVYTTHYMEEVERLCHRVAIMDEGCILALDTTIGLVNRLGAGVIYLGLPRAYLEPFLPGIRALPQVLKATEEKGRLKIETNNAHLALLKLIELCNVRNISILSLEMLEPTLESVFLHLTGKRLRD
jgi:ABC-2 type transport system ATP-binding protein